MTGPAGRPVGRVTVRVAPDTSSFRSELRRQLESETSNMEVEIPVRLDTDGLRQQIRLLQAELQQIGGVEIPIRADTSAARASIAQLRAAAGRQVSMPVDVDGSGGLGGTRNIQQFNQEFRQSSGLLRAIRRLLSGLGDIARIAFRTGTTALREFGNMASGIASGGISTLRGAFSQLQQSISNLGGSLSGMGKAAGQVITSLAQLGPIIAGVVGLMLGLAGAVQAVAGGIAAGITGLPVVFSALLGPIAAVVLGAERLQEIFSQLTPTVERLQQSVGNAFADALNVIEPLRNIMLQMEGPLQNIATALSGMVNAIVEVGNSARGLENLRNMFAGIERFLEGITDAVAVFIQESLAIAGTTELYDVLAGTISDVLTVFSQFLAEVRAAGLLTDVLSSLRGILREVVQLFADWAVAGMQFLNGAAPGIEEFIRGLGQFFNRFDWNALGEAFGRVFGAIGRALANIPESTLQSLQDAIINFANQVTRLIENGALNAFVQFLSDIVNIGAGVISLFNDLLGIMESISNFFSAIGDFISNVVGAFGRLGDAASNLGQGLFGMGQDAEGSRQDLDALGAIIPGLSLGLGDLGSQSNNTGSDMQGMAGDTRGAAGAMENSMSGAVGTITQQLGGRLSGAVNTGIGNIGRLSNGIRSESSQARGAASSMMSGIGSAIAGGVGAFSSGASIGSDFASGIRSQSGSVASAASSLASVVSGWLPSSPAERGPFSGDGWTYHRGESLVKDFSDGIRRSFTDLNQVVGSGMRGLDEQFDEGPTLPALSNVDQMVASASQRASAQWQGEINDPRFGGVGDRVAEALSSWQLQMNRDGLVRLVNEGNRELRRRQA